MNNIAEGLMASGATEGYTTKWFLWGMYRCLILLFSVSFFPFSLPQLSLGTFCSVISSFHFQCWTRCPWSCPKFAVFLKHLCPWRSRESIKKYSSPVSWIYVEHFEGVVSRVGAGVMCFASSSHPWGSCLGDRQWMMCVSRLWKPCTDVLLLQGHMLWRVFLSWTS